MWKSLCKAQLITIISFLVLCGCRKQEITPPESQSEYIIYHLSNGVILKFFPPLDSLKGERFGTLTKIRGTILAAYDPKWTYFSFSGPAAPGSYTIDSLRVATTGYDFYGLLAPLTTQISSYDSVGGFITGNFSGNVQWWGSFSAYGIVPISCVFRVRRLK